MMQSKKSACLAMVLAFFACLGQASAAVFTLGPADDTFATVLDPDTNFGSNPGLSTNLANLSQRSFTYIKFDLSSIPASERIVGATLNLFQIEGAGFGESGVDVFRFDDDNWSEDTLTWNTVPTGPLGATFLFQNPNGQFFRGYSSWNLLGSGLWDPMVDRADGFLSLLLAEASSNDQARAWCSKESTLDSCSFGGATGLPFLEVTTTLIPLPAALPLFGGALTGLFGVLGWRRRLGGSFFRLEPVLPMVRVVSRVRCRVPSCNCCSC